MATRQTNPDQHGRYRVRDKKNKQSGTWSSTFYNPDTMLLVPNANASDIYGKALPPKPYTPEPAAPPAEDTNPTPERSKK